MDKTIKKTKKSKKLIAHKNWLIALAVVFFIYTLMLILPCLYLVYNSVKGWQEFWANPWALPVNFFKELGNYIEAFDMSVITDEGERVGLLAMFGNSIFLTIFAPLVSLFCHASTAYAYARHRFKLKGVLYALMITPMLVNIAGSLPTTAQLIKTMGIKDNIVMILILYTTGHGFNFLLLASVFENISGTYKEAALIDGAGHWRIFITIYLPQASNMLISLYILAAIGVWNDYMTPYLYLPNHPTLATGIYLLQDNVKASPTKPDYRDWPKLFAVMILSILPVLTMFIVFQERIMTMAMGGGVKE